MNTDLPSPGAAPSEAPDPPTRQPDVVRHRTERDAAGRVWRFVYDPAAQEPLPADGMVRIRCTTGSARTPLIVRDDWLDWPRAQLLEALAGALALGRSQIAASVNGGARPTPPSPERVLARRRVIRDLRDQTWNCVFDPAVEPDPAYPDRVRVRCSAGRDRIDLQLASGWHRLGDAQLAQLIAQALDARGR